MLGLGARLPQALFLVFCGIARKTWVSILVLACMNSVTLGKLFSFSEPQSLHLRNGKGLAIRQLLTSIIPHGEILPHVLRS